MGWWTTRKANLIIGDGPADVLDEAVAEIHGVYKAGIGREATREELMALMQFCSGGICNGVIRMRRKDDEDNHPYQPAQAESKHETWDEQPSADGQDLQG
jgi:hypothetical protein